MFHLQSFIAAISNLTAILACCLDSPPGTILFCADIGHQGWLPRRNMAVKTRLKNTSAVAFFNFDVLHLFHDMIRRA
jgi:hypothetical protein